MIKKLLGWKLPQKRYKHYVAICCIVKDEHLYLPEWVDYHLKTGVTQFYIYDNGSVVPVVDTLSEYIDKGLVTVTIMNGKKKQMIAYDQCIKTYGADCKWIAFIDTDEFIVPKTLTGSLPDFLRPYEPYGGLGINWLMFGSSGHISKPEGLQVDNFKRRTLVTHPANTHIKTIAQASYVLYAAGNPHSFIFKKGKYCVNENFERIDGAKEKHVSNKIQLNHYFLRSLDEFKMKIKRGKADLDEFRSLNEFYSHDEVANLIIDENIIELKMLMDAAAKTKE